MVAASGKARRVQRQRINHSTQEQRSIALAREIVDLVTASPDRHDSQVLCVSLHLAFQHVWHALGGSEASLLAFVAAAMVDGPALYYGPRSRVAH